MIKKSLEVHFFEGKQTMYSPMKFEMVKLENGNYTLSSNNSFQHLVLILNDWLDIHYSEKNPILRTTKYNEWLSKRLFKPKKDNAGGPEKRPRDSFKKKPPSGASPLLPDSSIQINNSKNKVDVSTDSKEVEESLVLTHKEVVINKKERHEEENETLATRVDKDIIISFDSVFKNETCDIVEVGNNTNKSIAEKP